MKTKVQHLIVKMEEENISYEKQTDIFNPISQRVKIIVLGIGSLGSWVTLNLAKLGFNNISVYDFDIVEKGNISNQFFKLDNVGEYKVEALKKVVKEFTNIDIEIHNEKVDLSTKFQIDHDTIFVLTFDTLKERKMFFNLIKEIKCEVLDGRMGGEGYSIQVIDTFDDEDMKKWEKNLNIIPTTLPCGAKSICYTNLNVASEICNIIKKINNIEVYPKKLMRHMKNYLIINDLEKSKK